MKQFPLQKNRGFTLIETVVAILILSLTVGVLLTLTAGGIFSVRYARNQIVADNLIQESLEYIRNSRDSAREKGTSWNTWLTSLNVNGNGISQPLTSNYGCFNASRGCIVDPYMTDATVWEYANGSCSSTGSTACPNVWFYPDLGFYTYPSRTHSLALNSTPIMTTYVRRIYATLDSTGHVLTVTATISWKNGTASKSSTQSMVLADWGQ